MKSSPTKAAPFSGFILGTLSGLVALIILGFLGAFFWPLWLIAAAAVIVGPVMGLMGRKGVCPHCGTPVMAIARAMTCRTCRHRLKLAGANLVDVT